jgi:hypothetical protein
MVSATLATQAISVTKVTSADSMRLVLPSARLLEDGGEGPCLTNVEVVPAAGSAVHYTRASSQGLSIYLDRGVWRADQGMSKTISIVRLAVLHDDATCAGGGNLRLPIDGSAQFGDANSNYFVDEGDIKIYARAIETLFGTLFPLRWLEGVSPLKPGKLYLAEEIPVPPGSEIRRALDGETPVPWRGYVDAEMTDAAQATLVATVAANASEIEIEGLASAAQDGSGLRADVIAMAPGARVFNDPNISWLLGLSGVLLLGLNAILGLLAFFRDGRRRLE